GQDINAVTARLLGNEHIGGIVVLGIDPNGPANAAGFQKQDIIISIDGNKVQGRQSVMDIVTDLRPGTTVDVGIIRKGKEMSLKVTIAEDKQEA
ncbi:PDZ domain-containing protein, partial [Vibrio antiquarius]